LISTFLLKKIEEAIENGQSKDTGNIGHRTKRSKGKNTMQKIKMRSNTDPTKQTDGVLRYYRSVKSTNRLTGKMSAEEF